MSTYSALNYSLHYIPLHLPQQPYELVSSITKKHLQLSDGGSKGLKICISVPISDKLFNTLHIHKLKHNKLY